MFLDVSRDAAPRDRCSGMLPKLIFTEIRLSGLAEAAGIVVDFLSAEANSTKWLPETRPRLCDAKPCKEASRVSSMLERFVSRFRAEFSPVASLTFHRILFLSKYISFF